jgi:hypothetical protein
MTRSPVFWFLLGAASYWAVQHFGGVGTTGKSKKA